MNQEVLISRRKNLIDAYFYFNLLCIYLGEELVELFMPP